MRALLVALLLILAPVAAAAAPLTPDQQTQRGYVFTLDLLQRYATGMKALKAAEAKDPALKAVAEQEEDGAPAGIAKLKAHPEVFAFFKAQGFTERDAVLLGVAIVAASTAAIKSGSVGIARAPYFPAISAATSPRSSKTAVNSTPGNSPKMRAWLRPMLPRPITHALMSVIDRSNPLVHQRKGGAA